MVWVAAVALVWEALLVKGTQIWDIRGAVPLGNLHAIAAMPPNFHEVRLVRIPNAKIMLFILLANNKNAHPCPGEQSCRRERTPSFHSVFLGATVKTGRIAGQVAALHPTQIQNSNLNPGTLTLKNYPYFHI